MLIFLFFLISAAYLLYGVWGFKSIKSPFDYFHGIRNDDFRRKNLIASLTVANITLGTGLVYLIQGGLTNGFLFLLTPLSVYIGYVLLSKFIDYLPNYIGNNSNLIFSLDEEMSKSTNKESVFSKVLSYSLIIAFTLILSFEIFASSQVISSIVFNSIKKTDQIVVAAVITLVVLIYTSFNGIRGVIRTDRIQLLAIIISVILFVVFVYKQPDFSLEKSLSNQFKFSSDIFVACFTSAILAISTQFYSLINLGMITHVEKKNRGKLLEKSGLITAIILLVISLLGIFYPTNDPDSNFITRLTTIDGVLGNNFVYLVIFGFISMTFSTVDTLILTLSQFYTENIAKHSSFEKVSNLQLVRNIRFNTLLVISTVVLFLGFFNFYQPNLYFLLLGLGGPIAVFTPLIVLAGMLSKKEKLEQLTNFRIWIYFTLFLIAHLVYFFGISIEEQLLTSYTSILAFIFSSVFSLYIYKYGNSNP